MEACSRRQSTTWLCRLGYKSMTDERSGTDCRLSLGSAKDIREKLVYFIKL
jgi:hypothetical protein